MTRAVFSLVFLLALGFPVLGQTKQATPTPELKKEMQAAVETATRQVLAEDAQRKFSTDIGHAYVLKFVQGTSNGVVDAMRACDTHQFKSDAAETMIFVVSADGHIDLLFHELNNPYAQCISQHLHLPQNLPKPPGKAWPVQLRVVNGPRKTTGPDQPYATLSLPDKR